MVSCAGMVITLASGRTATIGTLSQYLTAHSFPSAQQEKVTQSTWLTAIESREYVVNLYADSIDWSRLLLTVPNGAQSDVRLTFHRNG